MLSFQKLDVYKCAIDFLAMTSSLSLEIPRGNAALLDQLRRAACSTPLNIAEAAGRTGTADAARVAPKAKRTRPHLRDCARLGHGVRGGA